MGLFQTTWLRSNIFRVCAVFGFGCFVELSQYFGYPVLGSTFDPLDILAYAGGVLMGVLLDLVVFPQLIPRWLEQ
jgi:hydrogenase maturation factor